MRSWWRSGGSKGELCLIDLKEAIATVAPGYPKTAMPTDHAERVVKGAWHLSPALGDRMIAAPFQDRRVFVRELLPQDLKFDIADLTREEAMKIAHFLARVVGKAHARQMDEATRKNWKTRSAGTAPSPSMPLPGYGPAWWTCWSP